MSTQGLTIPRFIDEREVAALTGFSLSKLRHDRLLRRGIPFVRAGRAIRYALADVLQYMESNKVQTEAK
jgi:predicted DNA-binding transcriptional regulator AlpA